MIFRGHIKEFGFENLIFPKLCVFLCENITEQLKLKTTYVTVSLFLLYEDSVDKEITGNFITENLEKFI